MTLQVFAPPRVYSTHCEQYVVDRCNRPIYYLPQCILVNCIYKPCIVQAVLNIVYHHMSLLTPPFQYLLKQGSSLTKVARSGLYGIPPVPCCISITLPGGNPCPICCEGDEVMEHHGSETRSRPWAGAGSSSLHRLSLLHTTFFFLE